MKLSELKPSQAIDFAIKGYRRYCKDPNFIIDMSTFGGVSQSNPNVCLGCLATCAVQEATGVTFTPENIGEWELRADQAKVDEYELDVFEDSINQLRLAEISFENLPIDIEEELQPEYERRIEPLFGMDTYMSADNAEACMPVLEWLRDRLIEEGY